jgi:hypothetical protein
VLSVAIARDEAKITPILDATAGLPNLGEDEWNYAMTLDENPFASILEPRGLVGQPGSGGNNLPKAMEPGILHSYRRKTAPYDRQSDS